MTLLLGTICGMQLVGGTIEFQHLAVTFSRVSIWPPGRHRHTIGGYAARPLAIRELRVDDGGGARSHASPPPGDDADAAATMWSRLWRSNYATVHHASKLASSPSSAGPATSNHTHQSPTAGDPSEDNVSCEEAFVS